MQSFADGAWHNEPETFSVRDRELDVTTDANTDFWRETHYGFVRDNGHFFAMTAGSSFTAQVRVRAKFEHLYDQAGLMLRLDDRRWVKAGIEFSDGRPLLGSVLTNEMSDWATGDYAGDPLNFCLRLTLTEGVLRIQASDIGEIWQLVRLCPFPRSESYLVGPMCCSPQRAGLNVNFSNWSLGPALGKDLHDLT